MAPLCPRNGVVLRARKLLRRSPSCPTLPAAAKYQQYLGQTSSSACVACSGTDWTSDAGSETCDVPYYDEACSDGALAAHFALGGGNHGQQVT